MRIADFIAKHKEAILQEWEDFARKIETPGPAINRHELRDHASVMLDSVVNYLRHGQSGQEQKDKSRGVDDNQAGDTPAEKHGVVRFFSGFTISQLFSEYRALRASVLRLWAENSIKGLASDAEDIMRFNESIDQLLAESVVLYDDKIKQSQSMFLAVLGHDLRSPLGSVIAGTSLILEAKNLDPACLMAAKTVHKSGKRISGLIENLLDFTRTRLGAELPIEPSPMNLARVAFEIIDELRMNHPTSTIAIETLGFTDGTWDERRMAQVLSNLISNAIKHGFKTEAVKVRVTSDQDKVVATVWNSGKPIQAERLGTIFDPLISFADSESVSYATGRSLGLGLHIAREIVLAHGGSLGVESTAESGTTFSIKLPFVAERKTLP